MTAGRIEVDAYDELKIDAVDGAAAVSASVAGEGAVSVSIGLSLAQNTIQDPVSALIQGISAPNATVDSADDRVLQNGDLVTLANGSVYEWTGADNSTVNLNSVNFTTGTWTQVGFVTTAAQGGTAQNVALASGDTVTIGTNYVVPTFHQSQGQVTLTGTNETVETAQGVIYLYVGASNSQIDLTQTNFGDTTLWRLLPSAGDTYTYVGPASSSVNLSNQNYSNTGLWIPVNSDVAAGASYTQTSSGSQIKTLLLGDTVTTTTGLVYRYIATTPSAPLDINITSNLTGSSWVLGPTPEQTGFTVAGAQNANAQNQILVYGDTVTLTGSYASGIQPGSVYRYIGQEQELNIDNATYSDQTLWQPVVANAPPSHYVVGSPSAAQIQVIAVENASIQSVGVAAALAISVGGGFGVAIAGGAAVAENAIEAQTSAEIEGSTLGSNGNDVGAVTVSASDTSFIKSEVIAAAAAVGVGGDGGVAAAIGISVARNIIGNGTDSVPTDDETQPGTGLTTGAGNVEAEILDSSVYSSGQLSVLATSSETISALVIAASTAVAGGTAGIGVAAGGTWVDNQSNVATSASIIDDRTTPASQIDAGAVTVDAEDTSAIHAFAFAGALSAGFGEVGVAVSIGISIAANTIDDPVTATIKNVPLINTGSGAIVVKANENAEIDSAVVAAAIAISGGAVGVSIAGAGADAENTINADTQASIDWTHAGTGTVDSGALTVEAFDTAAISADVLALAASVAVGATGVGVAVGISVAQNLIGDGTDDGTGTISNYQALGSNPSIFSNTQTLTSGQTVTLGANYDTPTYTVQVSNSSSTTLAKGNVINDGGTLYRYVGNGGSFDLQNNSSITSDTTDFKVIGGTNGTTYIFNGASGSNVDLANTNYANTSLWSPVPAATGAGGVSAAVTDTNVTSSGLVTVEAYGKENISALTAALSVALAGGGAGVAAGLSGVFNNNDDDVAIAASITGGTISATSGVNVSATDDSAITATAAAASVAVAFGATGAALAVGISLAWNTVSDTVDASVLDASISGGALSVSALKDADINAISTAASIAAGFGTVGVAVAGAGAFAENIITSDTQASVTGCTLGTVAAPIVGVSVSSLDQSTIEAHIVALSASVAVGAVGIGSLDRRVGGAEHDRWQRQHDHGDNCKHQHGCDRNGRRQRGVPAADHRASRCGCRGARRRDWRWCGQRRGRRRHQYDHPNHSRHDHRQRSHPGRGGQRQCPG